MSSIRIYILEDEIITQELLKQTLEDLNYDICGMSTDATTALKEIKKLRPDLALLDIKVDGKETGIRLGNQLDLPIIYLTAYNDYKTIKNAVTTNPMGYLVKPFNAKDLYIAVELAVSKVKSKPQIVVKEKGKNILIYEKDILFAKKEDQYLVLYLKNSEKLIRCNMKDFLEMLSSKSFLQVHRSYVVNKDYMTAFSSKEITVSDTIIPISKGYVKNVMIEIAQIE
ncbi:MAG: response regulator transcription factor [Nonlabens sp.]|nr:response regulator transcription factor [Nonlabens sp.]